MERKEEIQAAYRSLGKAHSLYDGQMLGSTVSGRWLLKHIWQMNREDALVSLNGFHAFPDKDAAWRETLRVLKPGGLFCGCFYVKGVNEHTDKWIRRFHEKRGLFTPPYETMESLQARLHTMYAEAEVSHVQSIAVFRCRKGNES